jgi:uncharacterized membrane protein YGL010W
MQKHTKIQELLVQYGKAHSDPRNKFCHKIGIPLIIISLVALLIRGPELSWAWWTFALGWGFQFVGHAFERSWPEFIKNPVFLLIGPLYFAQEILKEFNSLVKNSRH